MIDAEDDSAAEIKAGEQDADSWKEEWEVYLWRENV